MIFDASNCDEKLLADPELLEYMINSVAEKIKMNILVEPLVVMGVPENPGLTAFCIIDFSHISIHTFTNEKEFCLDIFSCKKFDYKEAYDFIQGIFKLDKKDIRCGIVDYDTLKEVK
jgi:S-adenosylmethionine decarboxylase